MSFTRPSILVCCVVSGRAPGSFARVAGGSGSCRRASATTADGESVRAPSPWITSFRSGAAVPACKDCNNRKQSSLPVEWQDYLTSLGSVSEE